MPNLEERVAYLEGIIMQLTRSDRYTFEKKIQILDGRTIQVGINAGTQIGTDPLQKLSLYGITPIVQQNAISAASGGTTIDSQARAVIVSLIAALKNFGVTK